MCLGDTWGWSIPQGTGIVLAALASLLCGNKWFAWGVCANPARFVLFSLSTSQKPLSLMSQPWCRHPLLPPSQEQLLFAPWVVRAPLSLPPFGLEQQHHSVPGLLA